MRRKSNFYLKIQLENLLMNVWENIPTPKPLYTDWYYAIGGPKEFIEKIFERESEALACPHS